MKDPAVETIVGFAGGNTSANSGRMFITLKPLDERKISADQVIGRLRRKLAVVPGATLFMQSAQDLTIGGRMSQAQFQYTLQGESLKDLNYWSPLLLQKLRSLPELRDVNTDQQDKGLEATVIIDRDTASRLGVDAGDIDNALYDAFGQRQVSIMYKALNQYHVVMEVAPEFSNSTDALQNIYVRAANGTAVPLSSFAHFGPSNTPLAVSHQGQYPSVTLSFNLAPDVSLGAATDAIDNAQRAINFPPTINASFQGTAAAFQSSLASEPLLILAALVTVYLVLGMLYESYIHPITILSTLPSAGVGAILALLLTHSELNVMGLIGIILLIGIVKKNAIMMIDFALETERAGRTPAESIYEACVRRFRPIMMTTMAALLGGLPLALGTGVGSELRRPLGITIVGGLIMSQALTLFTTPVVYLYLDRFRLMVATQASHRPEPDGAALSPAQRSRLTAANLSRCHPERSRPIRLRIGLRSRRTPCVTALSTGRGLSRRPGRSICCRGFWIVDTGEQQVPRLRESFASERFTPLGMTLFLSVFVPVAVRMGMHFTGSMCVTVGVDEVCAQQQFVVVQYLRRRARRNDAATLENVAVVRDVLHQVEIMGGGDHCLPAAAATHQKVDHLALAFGIKRGGGLVQQQDLRIEDQHGGQRDPFLFSRRKMMRRTFLQVRDLHLAPESRQREHGSAPSSSATAAGRTPLRQTRSG